MARRWLYGTLLVLAISLLVGTGSFTAMSADRGVNVAVVDDDSAFVGYDAACENSTLSVTVTNRFERTLTDGSVTVAGTTELLGDLDPGEQAVVTFDDYEVDDSVTVSVQSPTNTAELDRTVPSECQPPQD